MAVNKKDVQDIVAAIGGKDNVDTATHCVTRLRLVLKD
ncbi:PTS transporter subunit EIIB, partial [Staphylococcus arlettae]